MHLNLRDQQLKIIKDFGQHAAPPRMASVSVPGPAAGHHCPLSSDVLNMSSAPGAPYPPTKPPIMSPGPAWSPVATELFSTWPSKATPLPPSCSPQVGPLTFRGGSPNGPHWPPGPRLTSCGPFLVSGVGCPVGCPMPPPPTSQQWSQSQFPMGGGGELEPGDQPEKSPDSPRTWEVYGWPGL